MKILDRRAIIIALVGLLINAIPIIGFPCFIITFNLLVMSRIRAFQNRLSGCVGKVLFTFMKVLFMLIIVLLSSIIPFVGLLIYLPYGIYYLYSRKAFLKATGSNNNFVIAPSGVVIPKLPPNIQNAAPNGQNAASIIPKAAPIIPKAAPNGQNAASEKNDKDRNV